MIEYKPNGHAFLKIVTPDETLYKIMGSWGGSGPLGSDSWRINSGINSIQEKEEGILLVHGHSGSIYTVTKGGRGLNTFARSVLVDALEDVDSDVTIEIVTDEEVLEVFK